MCFKDQGRLNETLIVSIVSHLRLMRDRFKLLGVFILYRVLTGDGKMLLCLVQVYELLGATVL